MLYDKFLKIFLYQLMVYLVNKMKNYLWVSIHQRQKFC